MLGRAHMRCKRSYERFGGRRVGEQGSGEAERPCEIGVPSIPLTNARSTRYPYCIPSGTRCGAIPRGFPSGPTYR
jgi:hypothetical protein